MVIYISAIVMVLRNLEIPMTEYYPTLVIFRMKKIFHVTGTYYSSTPVM